MGFSISGINHLGLIVEDLVVAREFFCNFLGLTILQERPEILFLAAGRDILAVKTAAAAVSKPEHGAEKPFSSRSDNGWEALDHYGFCASSKEEVDSFANALRERSIHDLEGSLRSQRWSKCLFQGPLRECG